MAFDRRIIETKLALGMIPPEGMPPLAWDALEAGLDGPAVRRMAALEKPSGYETDRVLPRFMLETGLCSVSSDLAVARLAQDLILPVLRDGTDPFEITAELEALYVTNGYPAQLHHLGFIQERVELARLHFGESEGEIRRWVLERMRLLAQVEIL